MNIIAEFVDRKVINSAQPIVLYTYAADKKWSCIVKDTAKPENCEANKEVWRNGSPEITPGLYYTDSTLFFNAHQPQPQQPQQPQENKARCFKNRGRPRANLPRIRACDQKHLHEIPNSLNGIAFPDEISAPSVIHFTRFFADLLQKPGFFISKHMKELLDSCYLILDWALFVDEGKCIVEGGCIKIIKYSIF
ncbi:hypothetical protein CAEBREN_20853 [Caenorhabditis brenneri]|uniref:Uncharacterized protein n=1 Tax=Caenorhabditis brenneri TaxID=135651 RepID=G0NST5_CAEBE|nr:hypothetical protein CAEBREN_20853 [Caenorhabditis brenneri]